MAENIKKWDTMCVKQAKIIKILKHLHQITVLLVSLSLIIFAQSNSKAKLKAQIKGLTPSHSVIKSHRNIEIFGFDVLDEQKRALTSEKLNFLRGHNFYIVIYARRKITRAESPEANFLQECEAAMEHQNGGYFLSKNTSYIWRNRKDRYVPEEWKIGGVYKIQFHFRIPNLVPPGKYKLRIFEEKTNNSEIISLIDMNEINVSIKRIKNLKDKDISDYDVPLHECLLNRAFLKEDGIYFFWTGDVEYFFDQSLRNYSKVKISAKGTPADDVFPLLEIYIGEKKTGDTYINSQWLEYTFDLKHAGDDRSLKIRFANDYTVQGEDRNMFIRRIELVK